MKKKKKHKHGMVRKMKYPQINDLFVLNLRRFHFYAALLCYFFFVCLNE